MKLKTFVANILLSNYIGNIISKLFKNNIPFKKYIFLIPEKNSNFISSQIFFGLYESAEIRFIKKYIDDKFDVIELGSSLGVASTILGNILTQKNLYCIEANPNLINYLTHNLENNTKRKNYNILNYAICESVSDFISFQIEESNLDSHLSRSSNDNTVMVKSLKLSKLIERFNIGTFSLVSDIEGAEIFIILNDYDALKNCNLLIIELHDVFYNDQKYFVSDLIELITKNSSLCLLERYGNVCVFK